MSAGDLPHPGSAGRGCESEENGRDLRWLLVLALLSIIVGGTIDLWLDQPTTWLAFHVVLETLMIAGALLLLKGYRHRHVAQATGRNEDGYAAVTRRVLSATVRTGHAPVGLLVRPSPGPS